SRRGGPPLGGLLLQGRSRRGGWPLGGLPLQGRSRRGGWPIVFLNRARGSACAPPGRHSLPRVSPILLGARCAACASSGVSHSRPRANHLKTTSLFVRRNCRSEEHTSELQSRFDLVCRLLLEKKKKKRKDSTMSMKSK